MTKQPFPFNPYVIGVPITGEAGFYGRNDVFSFIEDTIEAEQQNVIVLCGQRRIGKTSMLHQIAHKLEGSNHVFPVYFDLQGKEQRPLGDVLFTLARAVARYLKMTAPKRKDFDNTGRYFRDNFLPTAYEQLGDRRLLLLFDEFDVLGDELSSAKAASKTLFPYLQDMIMHQQQIVFVFVVGRRIEELATHFQSIFKQAVYRQIGLLKEEHARTMITQPVKNVLKFEDKAIKAIIQLTNGHPYFTQLICYEAFNHIKAKRQFVVTEADIADILDQAIETGHGALTWFWEGLPPPERFIMSAVAHVTDGTGIATLENVRRILEKHKIVLTGLELKDAPDRLVKWEMLHREKKRGGYYFVVELVRLWILKTHPLHSARRDVDLISKRATRLFENARDAHTEGDLKYARVEYERALNANPSHSGAQLGLAQVLFELDEIEKAIEEFEKAYEIDDTSARDGLVRARLKKGKMLEEGNQQIEAIIQYECALKIAPTDQTLLKRITSLQIKQGNSALASNDFPAATKFYQQAMKSDKEGITSREIKSNLDNYIKKAEVAKQYENVLSAIAQYKRLLPKDKAITNKERVMWTKWGDILFAENQLEKALEAFTNAHDNKKIEVAQTALRREQLKGNQAHARKMEKEEKWENAVKAYKVLLKEFPEDGKWQNALKHAQTQAELSRLHQQAVEAIKKKAMKRASVSLAKIVSKQPDYKDALRLLLLAVEGTDVEKLIKRNKLLEKQARDLRRELREEKSESNYASSRIRSLQSEKKKLQAELDALKPKVPKELDKPTKTFDPTLYNLSKWAKKEIPIKRPSILDKAFGVKKEPKIDWSKYAKYAVNDLWFDKSTFELKWNLKSTGQGYLLQSSSSKQFTSPTTEYDGFAQKYSVGKGAIDASDFPLIDQGVVYYRVKAKPSGAWSNIVKIFKLSDYKFLDTPIRNIR